jgi:hypothetical protein
VETNIVANLSVALVIAAAALVPFGSRGNENLVEMPLRAPQKATKKRRTPGRPKNRPGHEAASGFSRGLLDG